MTDPVLIELVNTIILGTFTFLLIVGLTTTAIRRTGLAMRHIPAPRLLPRDLTLIAGLAWPFVLILMARAWTWPVQGQLWWNLLTGIPPIIGVGVYVYYEIFVIGQPEDWRLVLRTMARRVLRRD